MSTVIHELIVNPLDLANAELPIREHKVGDKTKTLKARLIFDGKKYKNVLYCVVDYNGTQLMAALNLDDALTRYNAIQVPIGNPQPVD